LSLVMVV